MVLAALVAGSLLAGVLAVAALDVILTWRGRPRLRIHLAASVALILAVFCSALGLLALDILDHARHPWAGAAALAVCGAGLVIVAVLVEDVSMCVGYVALGVVSVTEATGVAVARRPTGAFTAELLLFFALVTMIVASFGHILFGAQERARRLRGATEPGIDLHASSLVAGRWLLAGACAAALAADGLRLSEPPNIIALTVASAVAALCGAASVACFIALGIQSALQPISNDESRR